MASKKIVEKPGLVHDLYNKPLECFYLVLEEGICHVNGIYSVKGMYYNPSRIAILISTR